MWLKKVPFIRILPVFILGILIEQRVNLPANLLWTLLGCQFLLLNVFFILSPFRLFRFWWLPSIFLLFIFFTTGSLLTYYKDIRNDNSWYGSYVGEKGAMILTLDEDPVAKKNSYRATATWSCIIDQKKKTRARGRVYLYFDSTGKDRRVGERLITSKPIEDILNSGNPGCFDFKRFSLFKGITGTIYLKKKDYLLIDTLKPNPATVMIRAFKEQILNTIRNNIQGKKEAGLAEALLIGYKNDLDKDLSLAYTNTGTVHIIAISGMHLGLIYGLLFSLLNPIIKRRSLQWLKTLFILFILWAFSFLCGAQPSILRSTLMFTFILIGKQSGRSTSTLNSLASSAFLLLCMDPYSLWDIGFQLSYAAVTSILLFYKPISNWYYSNNKIVNGTWDLIAVTIAAQILTLPIAAYHFHQFPVFFIISNLCAVPLSGFILVGEIILYMVTFIPVLASIIGKILSLMIELMNLCIQNVDGIPSGTIKGLQLSIWEVVLLFLFIFLLTRSFFTNKKQYIFSAGISLILISGIRAFSFFRSCNQEILIVYNLPGRSAIELVTGRKAFFIGGVNGMMDDPFASSRSKLRISHVSYLGKNLCYRFGGKIIGIIDRPCSIDTTSKVTHLIIEEKGEIANLLKLKTLRQVILDASVPAKRTTRWLHQLDSLNIPCYSVRQKGAFVMNM